MQQAGDTQAQRFAWAIQASQQGAGRGIGRLSEKAMHAALKYYFEPNDQFHEVKIANYFADVANAKGILEVQTASFGNLRPKLEVFLESWPVEVVYPVAQVKYVNWVDPQTGEVTSTRKSPKRGSVYDICKELVYVKPFLQHPRLSFTVALLEVDEFKLLNGWGADKKYRASRQERIPKQLFGTVRLGGAEGYGALLPPDLPSPFSSKDYKAATRLSPQVSSRAMNVLKYLQAIVPVGKKGNLILYQVAEEINI